MCDSDCGFISIICGVIFGLFGVIGMLCMTAGYVANTNNNNALITDMCTTQAYSVVAKQCSYTCNCDSKGNNCHTCYYTCFDGFIFVNITNIVNMFRIYVLTADRVSDVDYYLSINYPVNKQFTCYRTTVEPIDVRLTRYDANSSFIAGIVFLSLAAATLVTYIIILCCLFASDIISCLCDGVICSRCSESKFRRQRKKLEAKNRKREEQERLEEEQRKARNSFIHDVEQPPPSPPSIVEYNSSPYNPNYDAKPTAPPLTQSQMTPL